MKAPKYTPEEIEYRGKLIEALCVARDDRESPHTEFDGMPYSQWFDMNRRADLSYLPPKQNKQDRRIVTGTTREKDTSMLSTLLSFNFEPAIAAFDEDNLVIVDLGETLQDLCNKSRQVEMYDAKRSVFYREYVVQGDVFLEEQWIEECIPDKSDAGKIWRPGMPVASANVEALKGRGHNWMKRAETRMIPGKMVYFGSMRTTFYWEQDMIFTYEIVPRAKAQALYGTWDRWDNVPYGVDQTQATSVITDKGAYHDSAWSLSKTAKNEVGILKIQKKFSNEYAVMLNGVLMTPVGYPLTEISPDGEYSITQGCFEKIPNFPYSKSQPSKTRIDQGIIDEVTKLMLLKFEQGAVPTLINQTKKIRKRSDFLAGEIVNDVKDGQIKPLFENFVGLNTGDFSFYNLIKSGLEEKTINKTYDGAQNNDVTATQYQGEKQQQMMKFGSAIDGIVNLERALCWKRANTVMKRYTMAQDTAIDNARGILADVFKDYTVDTVLDGGAKGKRIVRMRYNDMPSPFEQYKEEQDLTEKYGVDTKITYINPVWLMALKTMLYIVVTPTEKNNDKLSQLMFIQMMNQAYQFFGPQALNMGYLKQRFATVFKEDTSKLFADSPDANAAFMQMMKDSMGKIQNNGSQKEVTNPDKPMSMKTVMSQ